MRMTKIIRFQIIPAEPAGEKENGLSFKEYYKILSILQKESQQIANRCVQLIWEYSGLESDYLKKYKEDMKEMPGPEKTKLIGNQKRKIAKKYLGYSNITSYCYSRLTKEFNHLQTGSLAGISREVCSKFRSESSSYKRGQKSIMSFCDNFPINVAKKSIKLSYDEKAHTYFASLGILSSSYKKELGIKKPLSFKMLVKDKNQKNTLNKIKKGDYSIAGSSILKKKTKWFLNLSFNFQSIPGKKIEGRTAGVYLGFNNAVIVLINGCSSSLVINGGEIERFREKIEPQRISILKQCANCRDGRIGHGYKKRTEPARNIGNIISNYRKSINHKYSKLIVNYAYKHHCEKIVIENLKGISEKSKYLKKWSYFDLQTKIEQKAKEYDITVEKASQAYLQCRCSHCGNIVFDALSRDEFDCPKCGHKDKFDFNTCRNLTVPNIDNVIKHQIKSQIEEKKAYEKQTEKTAEKYQEIEAKEEARKLDNL